RDLGPEPAELVLGGRQVAVPGEGVGALLLGGPLPVADQVLADAESSGGLGDGEPLVGDHAQGLELELAGVGLAGHRCTPPSESTPLTRTPRTLGKLSHSVPGVALRSTP